MLAFQPHHRRAVGGVGYLSGGGLGPARAPLGKQPTVMGALLTVSARGTAEPFTTAADGRLSPRQGPAVSSEGRPSLPSERLYTGRQARKALPGAGPPSQTDTARRWTADPGPSSCTRHAAAEWPSHRRRPVILGISKSSSEPANPLPAYLRTAGAARQPGKNGAVLSGEVRRLAGVARQRARRPDGRADSGSRGDRMLSRRAADVLVSLRTPALCGQLSNVARSGAGLAGLTAGETW